MIVRAFVLVSLTVVGVVNADCNVCKDGSEMKYPETPLVVPDGAMIPVDSCEALSTAVGIPIVQPGSEDCASAQATGTICGCPIPENACRLCDDLRVGPDQAELDTQYLMVDYIKGAPANFSMTCVAMESFLHAQEDGSELCTTFKGTSAEDCCLSAGEVGMEVVHAADYEEEPDTKPDEPEQPDTSAAAVVRKEGLLVLVASGLSLLFAQMTL